MLSLSELAKIRKKKNKSKTKAFGVILEKCFHQIKNMAYRDQVFCYYTVPYYVLGLPLYNINECIVFLLTSLKKKGFKIQMANNQTIYISWKHIHERHQEPEQRQIPSPSRNNNWSQQNQRYVQPRQIAYHQPQQSQQMNRFIERSSRLL